MKELTSRPRLAALSMAVLSQWSIALVLQVLSPLAPLFQADLGLSKMQVGLISSATSVGSWTSVLAGGMLTDRLGIRRMMSAGLMAAGFFMLFMGLAGSLLQAMAIMFVASLARGISFPSGTKAILEWFPPRSRATAMGVKQLGMPAAGVFAGVALPALGLALGWRSAIVISGVLILASGFVIAFVYREAPKAVGSSAAEVSMGTALRGMIGNPIFLTLCFTGFSYHVVQMGGLAYLALYFKEVALLSAIPDESARILTAGGFIALGQFGGAFGRIFWGVLADRWFCDRRMVVTVIVGVLAALASFALGGLGTGSPLWLSAVVVLAFGATAVGWNGLYNTVLTETLGRKYAATGVGLAMTLTELGSISGPPIFGYVVDVTSSFQAAWFLLGCFSAVGTLSALTLTRQTTQAEVA